MAAKKVKEEQDLSERFVSNMMRHRPKKASSGTFEFVNSDETVLADVKYVVLTGIDDFDEFTGGFPFGRISEVFGLENCGKSAMMLRTMCRFQAKHIYEVISRNGFIHSLKRVDPAQIRIIKGYIDNEGSLEKGFKLGISDITFDEQGNEVVEKTMLQKTGLGRCDTVEQIFFSADEFINVIREAQDEEEEVAEEQGKEPRIILGVFIVDTVAGTSSKSEIEREWGKEDYPRAAGKISEGFRCLTHDFSRYNVAAIFTNQVRTAMKERGTTGYRVKFSTPQQDDYSTYGGKALSFYATHRIFMFQVPVKYTLVKGTQFPAGFLVGFRTVKNRLRKPLREARMVLLFDEEQGGLHNTLSILESLIFLKVAELHDSGAVSFKFRKFQLETTSFAENVVLNPKPEDVKKRRKRETDPMIDGRYQWLAFYKAHRSDLDKLHRVAIERANRTEGLDPFYEPEPGEDNEQIPNGEDSEPLEPSRRRRTAVPVIDDDDLR
jgi:RecA/RadA recombinase